MKIGKRIKNLRESKKMTLTQLSKDSGIQIATLSRIENEKMTGTLESHINIARALGSDITQLYQDVNDTSSPPSQVTDEALLEALTFNEKASYEILATSVSKKKMMPIALRIEPGGKTNSMLHQKGSEKFIFVLSGQLTAYIAQREFKLTKNKTLFFDASQEHYFANNGKETTKAIIVVTPVSL